MTAVGFAFFLGVLTAADASLLFTIGVLFSSLYLAVFVHMLLAYPDGRIDSPQRAQGARGRLRAVDRRPAAVALLFADLRRGGRRRLPASAISLGTDVLFTVFDVLTSGLAVVLVRLHPLRARASAGRPRRCRSGARWRRCCGRASACSSCWPASSPRWRSTGPTRSRARRPARARLLRADAVRLPVRTAALARRAGRRGLRAAAQARRRGRRHGPARAAVQGARRPLAPGRLLARGLRPAGSTPPAGPRSCPNPTIPRAPGRRSSATAAASARSSTTARCARTRS